MNNKERTLARENIVKILYQKDINQNDITTIISTFVEKRKFDNAYFSGDYGLVAHALQGSPNQFFAIAIPV